MMKSGIFFFGLILSAAVPVAALIEGQTLLGLAGTAEASTAEEHRNYAQPHFLGFLSWMSAGGTTEMRSRKVVLEDPREISLIHTSAAAGGAPAPAAAPAAAPGAAPAKAPAAEKKTDEKKKKTSEAKKEVVTQTTLAARAESYAKAAQVAADNSEIHLAEAKSAFKRTRDQTEKAKKTGKQITNVGDDIGDMYTKEKRRRQRKQRERENAQKAGTISRAAASTSALLLGAVFLLRLGPAEQ